MGARRRSAALIAAGISNRYHNTTHSGVSTLLVPLCYLPHPRPRVLHSESADVSSDQCNADRSSHSAHAVIPSSMCTPCIIRPFTRSHACIQSLSCARNAYALVAPPKKLCLPVLGLTSGNIPKLHQIVVFDCLRDSSSFPVHSCIRGAPSVMQSSLYQQRSSRGEGPVTRDVSLELHGFPPPPH